MEPQTSPIQVEPLEGRTLLSSYFVATTGADGNPGTLVKPFRTIQHAAQFAQPGDTVFVRAGIYREAVTPARSGTAVKPITYRPYNNENVTISGADVVSNWSGGAGGVYRSSTSWDLGFGKNQVFVDGLMINEARWPNTSLDPSHPTLATVRSATYHIADGPGASVATIYDPALTQKAGYWVGGTIHISQGQRWVAQTGTITAYSPGRLTYTFTSYKPTRSYENPGKGSTYFLLGKFAALDARGEWYRDPSGALYLETPAADSPSHHTVEVKRRTTAFDLSGRSHINVAGFHLFASTIVTSSTSAGDRLSGLDVKYVSHFIAQPQAWSQQQTSGIQLNGTNNVLENSTIAFSAGDGVFLGGSGNVARNCVIHDINYNAGDWAPVVVIGNNDIVDGNTIYNAGRSGVLHTYSHNTKILHNVIHDLMIQTTDGGGIYTYGTNGQGTEIAYNTVYNVRAGNFGAAGVYLDNFSSNYYVHNNLVWNTNWAMKLNPTNRYERIYFNTFADSTRSLETTGNGDMLGTVFLYNIFTNTVKFGPGSTHTSNIMPGVNPKFVNAGAHNYRLAAGSPAVVKGPKNTTTTYGYTGIAPVKVSFAALAG